MNETKDGFYSRFKFWIDWVVTIVTLMSFGAGLYHLHWWYHSALPLAPPKIVGPSTIKYAGEYCVFHVDSLSRDPKHLIFTWGVEPLFPQDPNQPLPLVRPTSKPGEAQLDTVAGRWRLSVSVADPASKTGQMVSIDVSVPHETNPGPVQPRPLTPRPSPGPDPSPGPPAPGPQPAPGRFSQFTADVASWLAEVTSPDKPAETLVVSTGASEVAEALRTGRLSHLSGISLRIAVASEVMANHKKIKNSASWSVFGQRVNGAASAAVKAGLLVSAADWAEFLDAFALGMK